MKKDIYTTVSVALLNTVWNENRYFFFYKYVSASSVIQEVFIVDRFLKTLHLIFFFFASCGANSSQISNILVL